MNVKDVCFYRTSFKAKNFYTEGCIVLADNHFVGSLTQDYIEGDFSEKEKSLEVFFIPYDFCEKRFKEGINIKLLGIDDFYLPKRITAEIHRSEEDFQVEISFMKRITDPYQIAVYTSDIEQVQERLSQGNF